MNVATLRQITDAIEAVLDGLYPTVPRVVRKRDPGPAGAPGSSLTAADVKPQGVFILMTGNADPVDSAGADFEYVSRTYLIDVLYAKPYAPGPNAIDEQDTLRTLRTNLVTALDVPRITGLTDAWVMRFEDGKPYDAVNGADTMSVSEQRLTVMTRQPRGVGAAP